MRRSQAKQHKETTDFELPPLWAALIDGQVDGVPPPPPGNHKPSWRFFEPRAPREQKAPAFETTMYKAKRENTPRSNPTPHGARRTNPGRRLRARAEMPHGKLNLRNKAKPRPSTRCLRVILERDSGHNVMSANTCEIDHHWHEAEPSNTAQRDDGPRAASALGRAE